MKRDFEDVENLSTKELVQLHGIVQTELNKRSRVDLYKESTIFKSELSHFADKMWNEYMNQKLCQHSDFKQYEKYILLADGSPALFFTLCSWRLFRPYIMLMSDISDDDEKFMSWCGEWLRPLIEHHYAEFMANGGIDRFTDIVFDKEKEEYGEKFEDHMDGALNEDMLLPRKCIAL